MDVGLIREYAESGMTRREIAEKIGMSYSRVAAICNERSIAVKRKKTVQPPRGPHAQTLKIVEMRKGGMTYKQIAKELGCCIDTVKYACMKNGLTIKIMIDQETVADYVNRSGFDYVGGYTTAKKPITVRCRDCGRTFERLAHVFRDVANGTWKAGNECPLCRQDRQNKIKQEQEAEREERRIKAEREAQEVAKRKAERLSRKIGTETTKRLATHVCKNCGVEFCQMVTGYNSEVYCSERCQVRWLNRTRSEKRYKTLMSRRHDNSISLERLYKRDNGICYLCGKQCDWEDGVTKEGTFIAGNNYPSIDHVVPVTKGGTHTWDNIKLAHRLCNTLKRDS